MHRNALEAAARIIYAHYTRRRLVTSALNILSSDDDLLLRLMTNRRIPSDIIRRVKDTAENKTNGSYHYALSSCRQVRKALRLIIREAYPPQEGERRRTARELLERNSSDRVRILTLIIDQVRAWRIDGFPFNIPTFQRDTIDYAASTENSTGQGYWFKSESEREDEIVLYIKTPPGIIGQELDTKSPYKNQTVRLRFLNWLPRKARRARRKAQAAREHGCIQRALQFEYRATYFEDMSNQLVNTIELHRYTRELARQMAQTTKNKNRIQDLKTKIQDLKQSRRSAPPIIKLVGKKVTLYIPFMPPGEGILKTSLLSSIVRKKRAGVDRGLRYSMVVSVKNEDDTYRELMIGRQALYERREDSRQRTKILMSQIARKRNNWEKKHTKLQPPAIILKKEQELESIWKKIRRLDKEISHQIASETVWFCENQGVRMIYFEDLRSFQGRGGMSTHSWNLSTNLWGMMIEGVRYRRASLGYKNGGIWLVNPAMTSQTCHVCGTKGFRVEDETSIIEKEGGEYFYCSECGGNYHADVNAARNIMHVQQSESSVVPGRTI